MRRKEDIGEEEVRKVSLAFRTAMGRLMSESRGTVPQERCSATLDRVIKQSFGLKGAEISPGAYYYLRRRIMKAYRGPVQRGFGFGDLPKRDRIVVAAESGTVPPLLRTTTEALDGMERDAMEEYCRRIVIGRSSRRALRDAINVATALSERRIAGGEYGAVLAELARRMEKRPRTKHDAEKWLKQAAELMQAGGPSG